MENKIQELTDKIYREGVEKGNEEARKLVLEAQAEAKKIVDEAHKEAEQIWPMLVSLLMNCQRIRSLN